MGDIVGYGPNPAECLEMVRCLGAAVVMGNHDEACIEPGREFELNEYARAGIAFARRELSDAQKAWLRNRPMRLDFGDFTAVHASLSDDDEWEYIFTPSDARRHFLFQRQAVVLLRTYAPACSLVAGGQKGARLRTKRKRHLPAWARARWSMSGPLGQPRNMRPEACYAIYDRMAHSIAFRFIPYDLKETQWKIFAAGLPPFLAQRLAVGR